MQNPLFLILIVRRNGDNFSEDGTQNMFNEHENSETKGSNTEVPNTDKPKSASNHSNDTHYDKVGPQGNIYLKPEKRKVENERL